MKAVRSSAEADLRRRLQEEERSEDEAYIAPMRHTWAWRAGEKYADLSRTAAPNYQSSFDLNALAPPRQHRALLLYAVVRIAGIGPQGSATWRQPERNCIQRTPGMGPGRELLMPRWRDCPKWKRLLPSQSHLHLPFELSQVFNHALHQGPVLQAAEPGPLLPAWPSAPHPPDTLN